MALGKNTESQQPETAPVGARARWTLFLLWLAYIISLIDRQAITMLVEPIKQDLGISDTMIGALQGITFALFFAIAGLPIALMVDRGSRRVIAAGGLFVWSLATAASGLAQSFTHLLTARFFVAAGEASLFPSATSLIADLFPLRQRGKAMSVYVTAAFLGLGLSYVLVGLLVSWLQGVNLTLPLIGTPAPWQMVFFILGVPGLLFALVMLTMAEPRFHPGARPDLTDASLRSYFHSHKLLLISFLTGAGLLSISANAILAWMPPLMMRSYGWSMQTTGLALGLGLIIPGLLGALAGGIIADRWTARDRRNAKLRQMMWFALATIAPTTGIALATSGEMTILLFVIFSLFFGGLSSVAPAIIQEIAPSRLRGRLAAIYAGAINIVGIGIGPLAVGISSDWLFPEKTGLQLALPLVVSSCALFAALALAAAISANTDRSPA